MKLSLYYRPALNDVENSKLYHRAAFSMIGNIAQGLVRFLYSVVIGRFMGPVMLANINSAISVSLLLSLLWPVSAGQAATRFIARARGAQNEKQAEAVATLLAKKLLIYSSILAIFAAIFCILILKVDLSLAMSSALLTVAYSGWYFSRGVRYGAQQISYAAVLDIFMAIIALGFLVGVVFFHLTPYVLLPLTCGYAFYAFMCWPQASTYPVETEVVHDLSQFVRYGILGTACNGGLLQLTMIVAKITDSPVEVGHFAAAFSLATPITMLANTLSQILFPVMAETEGRGDFKTLKKQTHTMTICIVILMTGVFGVVVLAAPLIIVAFYGAHFADGVGLLQLMLGAVMFTTFPIASVNRLNSYGTEGVKYVSQVAIAGLTIAVILWGIFAHRYGVWAVAGGYGIATVIACFFQIYQATKIDTQIWGFLWIKIGLAIAIVGILAVVGHQMLQEPWFSLTTSVCFAVFWGGINFRYIWRLWLKVKGR